jgi:YidC/Oxa1 family membrane protein insertase
MPEQTASSNRALRIAVPLVLLIVGLVIAWSVGRNTSKQQAPGSAPAAETASANKEATPLGQAPAPTAQPEQPASTPVPVGETPSAPSMSGVDQPAPAVNQTPAAMYRAATFSGDPLASNFASLGSLDPAVAKGLLEFSSIGAGVKDFKFSEHHTDWRRTAPYQVQAEWQIANARDPSGVVAPATLTPMAALALEVNGQFVVVASSAEGPTWRQVAAGRAGVFEAFIEDASGARVLRIERRYNLGKGYDIRIDQTVHNLTTTAMNVRWLQLGPVDLPHDVDGYGGDRRRMPFGYVAAPEADPARSVVMAHDYVAQLRTTLMGAAGPAGYATELAVWPNQGAVDKRLEISWIAMVNRYFGAALHAPVAEDGAAAPRIISWVSDVKRIAVNYLKDDGTLGDPYLAYRLDSKPMSIAAGGKADVSVGLWMGPLSRPAIKDEPAAEAAGLGGMVVNNMGGPCAFCTFDTITLILRGVMHFLHDHIFRDWSMAIIFLVVFVRTCLHPLTRWSQIRMQRFGKQMGMMQPLQKKIQERYKDDPKRMQQEMAALWREQGVSPLGMLGCLPMLAVTPVWLSLYALLFYAVELRNEAAFYGLIQKVTGNQWGFLADMSHPDAFIHFGRSFHVPLLSAMMGPISSFNILPLLLGVVFFFHQKYLSPPMTTQPTPEQEAQQRMVKIMSVVLFPLLMYNSPAGLSLYFATNSALAIVENSWIRRHINKHGLLDEDKLRGKPRVEGEQKKGFMQRLMDAAEQQRKVAEAKARKDQLEKGKKR